MFQATRPLVRWSSVETSRANVNGWFCSVELVKPNPRCCVAWAMAGMSSIGSLTGTCVAVFTAASRLPRNTSYTPSTSARKIASNLPRSSSLASSTQPSRSV